MPKSIHYTMCRIRATFQNKNKIKLSIFESIINYKINFVCSVHARLWFAVFLTLRGDEPKDFLNYFVFYLCHQWPIPPHIYSSVLFVLNIFVKQKRHNILVFNSAKPKAENHDLNLPFFFFFKVYTARILKLLKFYSSKLVKRKKKNWGFQIVRM